MCLGAIAGVGSALIGKSSSDKAASAQKEAAQMQAMTDMAIYNQTTKRFEPALESGNNAREALAFELGLGPRPTFGNDRPKIREIEGQPAPVGGQPAGYGGANGDPWNPNASAAPYGGAAPNAFAPASQSVANATGAPGTQYKVNGRIFDTREEAVAFANSRRKPGMEYQGFQETPGYQFQLEQGLNAIDNSAASRGNIFSGATLKRSQEYGQGLANQEYNNYLNRLSGMADSGQAAAGNMANAGANLSAGMGQALGNYGNAGAAGAIAGGNALMGGINTGLGIWQYQNTLNRPSAAQANNMLNQSSIFSTGAQFT